MPGGESSGPERTGERPRGRSGSAGSPTGRSGGAGRTDLPRARPPERPSPGYERISFAWFSTFAPWLPRIEQPEPPAHLHPLEKVMIPRPGGSGRWGRAGRLSATWFPADGSRASRDGGRPSGEGAAIEGSAPGDGDSSFHGASPGAGTGDGGRSRPVRGAVLLLPPWVQWGRSYFHRRGRIPALRRAGYHVLTLDFPGFGDSGPRAGFYDRDVEAGLKHLAERCPGLPLHLWGVSAGGYWSHMVLSRRHGVAGAMFEDVSPHLLEWAGRAQPLLRPAHVLFRTLFPRTFRYFDLRRHAPALKVPRAAYAAGGQDPGIPAEQTRELARLAGAEVLIVPEAGHLEAIKVAEEAVIALALATFREGEQGRGERRPPKARNL